MWATCKMLGHLAFLPDLVLLPQSRLPAMLEAVTCSEQCL